MYWRGKIMSRWAQAQMNRYQQQLLAPSLDELIGATHGIRLFDEMLLQMDWSEWEKQYACEGAGRPPIHPRLLAGCILYGLLKRIRSTRDLEEATRMRLDFRWLMDGTVVDHTTFCVFRKLFGGHIDGLFKQLNRRAAALKQATLEEKCIRGQARQRRVCRDQYEPLREQLAQRMDSPEAKTIYGRRAPTGERVFATIKASMGIRRFRVRGKAKVHSEWLWICTAYNLMKLLRQGLCGIKRSTPAEPGSPYDPKSFATGLLTFVRPIFRVAGMFQTPDALAA